MSAARLGPGEDSARTCGACRFSHPYAPPNGPKPEMPEPPKISLFSGTAGLIYWDFQLRRFALWSRAQERHKNKAQCRRFPAFQERRKTEVCGEFQPRDSDAGLAEDAKRLSPEGAAARAEGIARQPSSNT